VDSLEFDRAMNPESAYFSELGPNAVAKFMAACTNSSYRGVSIMAWSSQSGRMASGGLPNSAPGLFSGSAYIEAVIMNLAIVISPVASRVDHSFFRLRSRCVYPRMESAQRGHQIDKSMPGCSLMEI